MIKMGSFTGLREKSSKYTHTSNCGKKSSALWVLENKTQQSDTAAATNRSSRAIGHPEKLHTLCAQTAFREREMYQPYFAEVRI